MSLSIVSPATAAIDNVKPKVPNQQQTPGDLCDVKDPDFAGHRYKEKIPYCMRNVSYQERWAIYEDYNVPENIRGQYTIDHLIPLSLGGSNEPTNLWPEHKKLKATRPYLEQEVFNALRDGQITQKKAIQIILEAKLNPVNSTYMQ